MKKALSIFIAVVLLFACASAAFAAGTQNSFGAYKHVFIIGVDGGTPDKITRDRDIAAIAMFALGVDRPDAMSARVPADLFADKNGEIRIITHSRSFYHRINKGTLSPKISGKRVPSYLFFSFFAKCDSPFHEDHTTETLPAVL